MFWSNAKRGALSTLGSAKGGWQTGYPRLSKGETAGSFSKIQKLPQTSPNFLKIVEKISFHQNNYFRSIKTCFKIFWSNAKGTTEYLVGLSKGVAMHRKFFKNSKTASN
jgi:hypothetical protein